MDGLQSDLRPPQASKQGGSHQAGGPLRIVEKGIIRNHMGIGIHQTASAYSYPTQNKYFFKKGKFLKAEAFN
jgi:hypothetical protein